MGMFDYITCQAPLPWPREILKPTDYFQTKDLENSMSSYTISENGRLCVTKNEYKIVLVSEEEKQKRKKEAGKFGFPSFLGHEYDRELVSSTLDPVSFTGSINFYDYLQRDDEPNDIWIEFVGFFSNGYLIRPIELFNYTPEPNNKRKESEKKFVEQMRAREQYVKTWKGKLHLKYEKIIGSIFYRGYFPLVSWLTAIGHKLHRKLLG